MSDIRGPERGCLATLELHVVRRVAATLADSEPGRGEVERLTPSADRDEVRARLGRTAEMASLVRSGRMPSLQALMDMGPLHERLSPEGATASPEELLGLARHLRVVHEARRAVLAAGDEVPGLRVIAEATATFPALLARLERTIEDDGSIKDGASPELAKLRTRLKDIDRRMRRTIEQMLARTDVQDALSEALVTVREDRLVLPVKAERRSKVPGVLRGRSSTGQTLYVEPQAVVGMGDEKREVAEDERKEILRILRELADEIRPELPVLLDAAVRVSTLDAIKAVARLGTACRGTVPKLDVPEWAWDIRQGRHPLLDPPLRPLLREAGLDVGAEGDIVPVSVALPAGSRTLVLTGPNTGGKTATLKLVGLLHLMAQCGMLVPAGEGTALTVFRTVLADIGDEQSLTQSLSTFSSHVARIAGFFGGLGLALPALVVLDELGAGTDPKEGEALGLAILEDLRRRGAHVVASTHYGAIKSWALATPDVLSVAMEWDEETLRPTYRLSVGATGSSHALPIATRLKLDARVIARAQEILEAGQTAETRRVADLTRELHAAEQERERLLAERAELERTTQAAELRVEELRAREAKLAVDSKAVIAEARRKVRGILAYVEDQSGKLLAETTKLTAGEARRRRKEIMERASRDLSDALPEGVAALEPLPEPERVTSLDPAPGRKARVRALGLTGSILEVRDGRVHVDVKGKRLWVKPAEIDVVEAPAARAVHTVQRADGDGAEAVPLELSLIGMRVEEAIDAADRYLDRAATSGLATIRIVHGFGTGRLRTAIRDYLRHHALVKEFRAGGDGEGGGGATVVTLR